MVRLTGKSFAVLHYLIGHAGQLVRKDDLFQSVWPGTIVSDATLTSCIKELRKALADDAKTPRYIETIHRRGYRFIAPLVTAPLVSGSRCQVPGQNTKPRETRNQRRETVLIGREKEFAQLHYWLEKALTGKRQLIFMTGEPGIGKTTVVEAFLERLKTRDRTLDLSLHVSNLTSQTSSFWLGRGQCIEHYGAGEAYMPVLEALSRLCHEKEGEQLTTLLHRYAPTWLVQMPAVLHDAELEALQRKTRGVGRERMLREMAEAIEVLTALRPLVLVLEDLHWSDYSTLELLTALARRREPARLLAIGTYRPADLIMSENPLKGIQQELQLHQHCQELALPPLKKENVTDYLSLRFPGPQLPRVLGSLLHQRTDGNPLFMVNVVDSLVTQRIIVQQDGQWRLTDEFREEKVSTPETIRQMVEQQIKRLSAEEQAVLEAASVVGAEFSTATVAVAVAEEVGQVEEWCKQLARRGQFLRVLGVGEWPEGTLATRYGFTHMLYRSVIYDRLSALQRIRFHQRIGAWEEEAYGNRADERAAELAVHFERGREVQRAVKYYHQAALNASQRHAYLESIALLTKGLALLKTLPNTVEHASQELSLQLGLGIGLVVTQGPAAPAVGAAYTRAQELCRQVGDTLLLFPVLWGLRVFHLVRGELHIAQQLGKQALRFAQHLDSEALRLQAHLGLGMVFYYQGEFTTARTHFAQGASLYEPQRDGRDHTRVFAAVSCLSYQALALWLLGHPQQALQRLDEAIALAQARSSPFSEMHARNHAAILHQFRGDGRAARHQAEAALALARQQGFPLGEAMGTSVLGHALASQGQLHEGIAHMRQGLDAHQALGVRLGVPSFMALLAEASVKAGQGVEELRILTEALAIIDRSEERFYEAEIHRLYGALSLQKMETKGWRLEAGPFSQSPNPKSQVSKVVMQEAEKSFLKAIDIARQQQAKSLELRAATSLARLWQRQGWKKQAHKLLSEAYDWFTEGFDTVDLQEAQSLLAELSERRVAIVLSS